MFWILTKKFRKKISFRFTFSVLYFSKKNIGKNKILFDSDEIWSFRERYFSLAWERFFWRNFFSLQIFPWKNSGIKLNSFDNLLWLTLKEKIQKYFSKNFFSSHTEKFSKIFFHCNSHWWKILAIETLLWISVKHINVKR